MGTRVVIYARLSDEDRYKRSKGDDSDSVVNQKSMLLKYALSQGWEVVNVYSDDDYSGADMHRPEFQKMLWDCENGLVDIVLCKTQSRFSRDMEVIERYLHNKFVLWGVRFVSIVDHADTEVEGNKKSRQINGLVNEWYLEDLSRNVRKSLQNKREDGLYLGAFAPYGYLKDRADKNKLVIDPVASEVVREIFALYKSGWGYAKIAKELNDRGILAPASYKSAMGSKYVCRQARFGNLAKWGQDTIARILRNEVYIGNLVQGKRTCVSYKNRKVVKKPENEWTRCQGTHDAIIDKETWAYVQAKFGSRLRSCRTTGEVYCLSKKVYCKECMRVFTRQIYHTARGKMPYLKCKSIRMANFECDNSVSIQGEVLEKIILGELNKLFAKYFDEYELEGLYALRKDGNREGAVKRKDSLLLEREGLIEKIEKRNFYYQALYEDKIEKVISLEEFEMLRKKYVEEVEEARVRIGIIDKELIEEEKKDADSTFGEGMFEKYRVLDVLRRELVEEFIEEVWVGKVDCEKKRREIEIVFNMESDL